MKPNSSRGIARFWRVSRTGWCSDIKPGDIDCGPVTPTKAFTMRIRYRAEYTFVLIATSIAVILMACTPRDIEQSATSAVDHLVLTFKSNHSRVKVGDTVQMQFTVTNTGQEPIVLESSDRPVLDLVVAVPGGYILRRWSSENPDMVSHRIEWKPGESHTLEMTWTVSSEDKLDIRIGLSGDVNSGSATIQSVGVVLCLEGFCS